MSDELLGALIDEVKALRATVATAGKDAAFPREYFDREDAARYICLSVAKLDKLAAAGDIKRAKLGEGQSATVLYRRKDLDAFVAQHCLMTKGEARLKVKA